jgi:hypothetical protein
MTSSHDPYQDLPDAYTHRQILHQGNVVHATNTEYTACGYPVTTQATTVHNDTPVECSTCHVSRAYSKRYHGIPAHLRAGQHVQLALTATPGRNRTDNRFEAERALRFLHVPDRLTGIPYIRTVLHAIAHGNYATQPPPPAPQTDSTPPRISNAARDRRNSFINNTSKTFWNNQNNLPSPYTHRQTMPHGKLIHATNTEHTACGCRILPGATTHAPDTPLTCRTCDINTDARYRSSTIPDHLFAGWSVNRAFKPPAKTATELTRTFATESALKELHAPAYMRTSPHIAAVLDAIAQGDYATGLDWGFPDDPDYT